MRTFASSPSVLAGAFLALALLSACSSEPKKDATKPQQAADERDALQAALLVPWPKDGAGLKAGSWIEIQNQSASAAGKVSRTRVAVVGETGDTLQLEESGDASLGFIEGLTVAKADGKIAQAVAGKKGEAGRPIKIGPAPTPPAAPPTGTDESVTVPAGTYAATKTVISGQLSDTSIWVAKEGDAQGLTVKWSDDMAGTRELKTLAKEDLTVAGKPVPTTHATFSDGSEEWWVRGLPVPFVAHDGLALVKSIRAGNTYEATWGDDAKAELDGGNSK
jgi:hypothetical protein